MITRHKRREPAFTIVELIIVITVIAMLAGMTIFAFGSWRVRTATVEVKNETIAISAAMKHSRTFNNNYPTSIPSSYKGSSNITTTYNSGDDYSYCIDVKSKAVPDVYARVTQDGVTQGFDCSGSSVSGSLLISTATSPAVVSYGDTVNASITVNAPTSNKKSMNIASFNTVVVPANGISPQTPVYTCQSYVLAPGASTTCTGSYVITPNYSPSPGINFSINYSPV